MAGGSGGRMLWRRFGNRVSRCSSLRLPFQVHLSAWLSTGVDSDTAAQNRAAPSATAQIIDGKSIAADIKSEIAREVHRFKSGVGMPPGLAVVLVGKRNESHSFVGIKIKACKEVGIASQMVELPAECREDQILKVVSKLNNDSSIHGIIVQLPLPEHVDEDKILDVISPEKDVDGFHPVNMGNLALRGREPLFVPCAAKACIELILRSGVEITEKNAAVIGRSKIVGLPASLLLQRYFTTVSVVHEHTHNPEVITREAEIVITDAGMPNLVRGSWLKPGAIVIDAGTNAVKNPNSKKGFNVCGDVCYEEAIKVASAVTPVPGGVGPVTIAMLLSNTLDSAKRAHGFV
ncbi:hypothetical protein V2J09_023088 [Rumex salicifolius]